PEHRVLRIATIADDVFAELDLTVRDTPARPGHVESEPRRDHAHPGLERPRRRVRTDLRARRKEQTSPELLHRLLDEFVVLADASDGSGDDRRAAPLDRRHRGRFTD